MKKILSDKIPMAFVYASAGITVGILLLILGYIIVNGLFYSKCVESPVLSFPTNSLEGLVFVVNKEVGVDEMPYDYLQGIFTDKYSSWKQMADVTQDVYPYVSSAASGTASALFGKIGRLTAVHDSAFTVIELVAGNKGGIGIVTQQEYSAFSEWRGSFATEQLIAADFRDMEKSVRTVKVKGLKLGVNSQVIALFGNFKISSVPEEDLALLFSGKIQSWEYFGGPDLPVKLLVPMEADFYGPYADAASLDKIESLISAARELPADRIQLAEDAAAFCKNLSEIPGAVGIIPAWLGGAGTDSLDLVRTERGRNLSLSFLLEKPVDGGRFGGISTIILNTLIMIVLTLLLAVPPGLFAAIYLVEYAKEGKLLRILRLGTETLAGIPSIIFGLFGMLVFVQGFGWGICLLSGAFTVALMILPTIIRTAEEALLAVPRSLQEGSLALGGTKVQTLFRVVLPAAFPAISAGIILAIGRALGESAALIYTMGSNYSLTRGLFDSTRTLAVHLYLVVAEGISSEKAFASATVLVLLVFIINSASKLLIKKIKT